MAVATLLSVSSSLDAIGFGRWQWLLLAYTGLAWMAHACEGVLMAFVAPSVACDWDLSTGQQSLLQSIGFAGSFVGLYVLGAVSDTRGRRAGFVISALLMCAFGAGSAAAPNLATLLCFRFLVGMAIGGAPIVVTLFAEMVPSTNRARWSVVLQGFWTLGTLLQGGIAWAVLPGLGWRWLAGLSAVPAFVLLATFPLLMESPYWLNSRRRHTEAEAVVTRIATVNRWAGRHSYRLSFGPSAPNDAEAPADGDGASKPADGSCGAASTACKASSAVDSEGSTRGRDGEGGEEPAAPAELSRASVSAAGKAADGGSSRAASSGVQQQAPPGKSCLAKLAAVLAQAGAEMADGLRHIFGRRLLATTLLLWGIWLCFGFVFDSLIILTPVISLNQEGKACLPDGSADWQDSDFILMLAAAAAEVPGFFVAIALVEGIGRRRTMGLLAGVTSAAFVLLACRAWGYAWLLVFVAFARAGMCGAYAVINIYTPEVYPTTTRSFANSMADGWGRLGAFAAPFAILPFINAGDIWKVATVLACLSGAAAAACILLPLETLGKTMSGARRRSLGRSVSLLAWEPS